MYPDINLPKTVFIVEFATAYPGASTSLTTGITSVGKIPVIPVFLREYLDDIIIYINRFLKDREKILLGYTTQLLYVTPKKFKEINPCSVNFKAVVATGEPVTSGAYTKLYNIYCPEHVIGLYASTETRIQGLDNGKGEYYIYADRTLIAVRRRDETLGIDGEGELVITPLYVKGEIPGTILPMYMIGDHAQVKYEDGMYIIRNISRSGDELQIGATNFNPIVISSLIEDELAKNGFKNAEVLIVLRKDPETGLVRIVDINVVTERQEKERIIGIIENTLAQHSELPVVSNSGLIKLNIEVYPDVRELLEKYRAFRPVSYCKGRKYVIID